MRGTIVQLTIRTLDPLAEGEWVLIPEGLGFTALSGFTENTISILRSATHLSITDGVR